MSEKPRTEKRARLGAFTGEEIAARVRKYYKEGKRLLKQSTRTGAKQSEPDSTDDSGPSPESIRAYEREYRRFANLYKPEELEELLKLRSKKYGTPLGWGIVRKLIAVSDRPLRRKLELRAANESWSVLQCDAFVHERVFKTKRSQGGRPRSQGGRPLAEPKNLTELLQRLEMQVGVSQRRLSHWSNSDLLKQTPSKRKMGKSLRARVLAISEESKKLAKTAMDLSGRLESIAVDSPEVGKGAPDRAVEAQSTKKPS